MPLTGNMPTGVPHPTRSLGYGIIRWCQRYILQPDGENAGQPWRFSPEQLRFVLWLYAIDERGRWLYRSAALRRAKGWGLRQDPTSRGFGDRGIHRPRPLLPL
ncbi:hypothetical protein GCM10009544_18090 [Streptomyces stramineus]|uniref:Integrase n=1 Tax=Streptomyces stramineus TaxID=173861 RepID=A0ABN0ZQL2_9ACTN